MASESSNSDALGLRSASQQKSMMSSRTMKWTSVKVPATSVGKAMEDVVSVRTSNLVKGIPVQKVTSRGHLKPRVVTVSRDMMAVFITHQAINKKKDLTTNTSPTTTTATTTTAASSSTSTPGKAAAVGSKFTGVMSTVASKLPVPVVTRKGIWGLTGDLRERYVRYVDVADIDFVCTGTVSTRKLEQSRTRNRLKGMDSKIDTQKQEIVTIGHHGDQTLDVLVSNASERKQLMACIATMRETFLKASLNVSHDALLMRYIWYDVDENRDGLLSDREFGGILARINFDVKYPQRVFRKFCKERGLKRGGIVLANVLALLMTIKNKESGGMSMANRLWHELFGDKTDVVGVTEFMTKFVHGAQGETSKSMEDVTKLIMAINGMEIDHKEGEPADIVFDQQLSRARFEVYLYHELNDAYDPKAIEKKSEPLSKPMSQYHINTSHNTYLTGDQLQSTSSVEMYGRSLRRGCKCLELDCWDGDAKSKKDDFDVHPVVFHGHTLTSKILFADVLSVVENYLEDHPDTYPIILSLENHCSHAYQRVMASLLVETFGPKLYRPSNTPNGALPSPEALRGMIVIKGKRPPDDDLPAGVVDNDEHEEDPYEANASDRFPRGEKTKGDPNKQPVKPPKVVPELARLTLFHGTKFRSFEASIPEPESHMHSIGETKITKILNKNPKNVELWKEYNRDHMTRTYPSGARVDSSNYNPLLAWAVGCQLVALNFQTNDSSLVLNDGMFRQNAGCGYLAKNPSSLVKGGKSDGTPSMKLKVRVLSGSCLPKPMGAKTGETIDPYVNVTLHDVIDSGVAGLAPVSSSHYTNTITNNGFCPIWNEKEAKEFLVYNPEIAMVEFGLKEADLTLDDDVGYAAIPIHSLRTGYRSIQLYDRNNTRTGPFSYASLLVEIQLTPVK